MKKTILKILLIVAIIAIIAVSSYFLLKALGFTTVEDFERLRADLGDSVAFWAVIVLLQTFQVVFIPISNSLISGAVATLFNNELWKVFLSSWIGIEIGTIILYFIGRYGGKKLLGWVLGDKKKVERCKNFMLKGRAFYPIGMLIFIIPDDIISCMAGMSGYNFWYVLIVSTLTRGACVATTVFGLGYATKYPWLYAVLAVFLSLVILFTVLYFRRTLKHDKNN